MMPSGSQPHLLSAHSLHQSEDVEYGRHFTFDIEKQWFMWFSVRGLLVNEGSYSARIRLARDAQLISGVSALAPNEQLEPPPLLGRPDDHEYLLRPGEKALFEWGYGHTLGEWAEAYENRSRPSINQASFLEILVQDSFEHGIVDYIFIEAGGYPLVSVPGTVGGSQWQTTPNPSEGLVAVIVYPTQRKYRAEGGTTVRLPYAEKYGITPLPIAEQV